MKGGEVKMLVCQRCSGTVEVTRIVEFSKGVREEYQCLECKDTGKKRIYFGSAYQQTVKVGDLFDDSCRRIICY